MRTCLLLLFFGLFFGTACTGRKDLSDRSESYRYARFAAQNFDSISTYPGEVRRKAFAAMRKTKDSVVKYSYLSTIVKTFLVRSQMDSVWTYLQPLGRFVTQTPFSSRLADLYADYLNTRGNYFVRSGYADSAVFYYQKAFEMQRQGLNKATSVDILINLADAHNQQGRLDAGAACYRHALLLCDSLQLSATERYPIYYGLGHTYMQLRDFESCDYFYNLASAHYQEMSPNEKQFYLNNRGSSYYFRQDYATAVAYFHRLIRLTQEYPDMNFERNLAWINLADCFVCMQQADSAAHYLDLCEPFFRDYGMPAALYSIDTQKIGVALLRHNLAEARRLLQHSLPSSLVYPDLVHVRHRGMQLYYEYIRDYKKAYEFMKLNTQLDDSIRNERIQMRTAELALRYQQDSTLMSQKVLIQKKENEVLTLRQNFFMMVGIAFIAIIVGIFLYMYNKKKRALLLAENRRVVSSLRLENIRNRLSPHFIFNVLNQEITNQHAGGPHELGTLVKLMRRNLELAEQFCVTLAEELEFVQTYLELERRSLGDLFLPEISCDSSVDPARLFIPSMLIQIPVENAVKHALHGKEGNRCLWIRIQKRSEALSIRITDNGGGFRPNSLHRGTGTGMKVIMQTIQILNAKNACPIEVSVHNVNLPDGEVGCEVEYLIPDHFDFTLDAR